MSESRPSFSGFTDRPQQLSFLPPDDVLLLHQLRHLVAEAQRMYHVRAGFDATDSIHLQTPADVARLLIPQVEHLQQEQLHVLNLTVKHRLVSAHMVYQGTISSSPLRVAEVFRPAIIEAASCIVVAHNHPSGDPAPSPEDLEVSRQLVAAGELLDIEVIDHIIIGHRRWLSLRERGLMPVAKGGGRM